MRVAMIAAGLAVMLAACGGEKKAADAEGSATNPAPAAEAAPAPAAPAGEAAPAAAATGATVNVDMVLEGTKYLYVPAELKVKSGDVINFKNVSGGPHNVAFKPGQIPSGSEAPIDAALGANKMGPLTGNLVVEQNGVFTLATGGFPKGDYAFACTPHEALGMKGKLTVE
ncbi:MAG TPA: plastocyanin/azurin family copper-binding protein [Gemmatimonadales bacterium]|nr:plastocyanin/azurin family copper-binding protein [Gemmatimonadales bacterium]